MNVAATSLKIVGVLKTFGEVQRPEILCKCTQVIFSKLDNFDEK